MKQGKKPQHPRYSVVRHAHTALSTRFCFTRRRPAPGSEFISSGASGKPLSLSGLLYFCLKRRLAFCHRTLCSPQQGLSLNLGLPDLAPSHSRVATGCSVFLTCWGLTFYPCTHTPWSPGVAASPYPAVIVQRSKAGSQAGLSQSQLRGKGLEAGLPTLLCRTIPPP